jgi:Putative adhesin
MTTPSTTGDPAARRADQGPRWALRFLAIVISVLLVAFGAWTLVSLLARSHGHRSASYTGVTTVETDLSFDSLRVTASDSDKVTLDRSYSWSFGRPTVTERRIGDRLVVSSSDCGFTPGIGCTGSVRLVVPRNTMLHLHTSNSSLTLRDMTGDIDATTSNGAIDASGLTGALSLHTSNGHVEATGLRSSRVEAATSNGAVRLTFDAAPTAATANTSNGAVTVVVPRDGTAYSINASTSNGAKEIAVPSDPSSRRSIEAHTSNGALRVLDRP